jgi:hypothetical protein
MRSSWMLLLWTAAACGGSYEPPAFTDVGGELEIDDCNYKVTTKIGAEPPRVSKDFVGEAPTPRLVHLGLMGDPRTTMVAQWRTMDEITRNGEIRYAEGADLDAAALTKKQTGIEFGYQATGSQIYRMHQAHLCGLLPNTTYSYQVGSEGHYSPVRSFTTAPDIAANPDAQVVFGFMGDTRDGYDIWEQLSTQIGQRTPNLILFSGDAVTIGLTQVEWESFFARAEELLASVPIVFAHGNHEVNATPYFSQFAMPGDQENYGFDYGHAHITVANDTPVDISALTGSTVDFLKADFEASKNARWKLLMHHQPMWSASNHGSNLTLQQKWQPIVDQYHIDLVLNGHEHEFEITKPMVGQVPQTSMDNATVYVVAGGGGAELYASGTDFWTQYSESTHNAGIVRVRRDQLVFEAFRVDGTVIPGGFTKTKP